MHHISLILKNLIKKYMPTNENETQATKKKKSKRLITITIKKSPNGMAFTIKAAPEVESFFKNQANAQTFTSTRWKYADDTGTNFYSTNNDEGYANFLRENYLTDDVGSYLTLDNGTINFAFFRAVGIANGITIHCPIQRLSESDNFSIEKFIFTFAKVAKVFYRQFIEKKTIKASVVIEL